MLLYSTLWVLSLFNAARAVTVYGQIPLGQASAAAAAATATTTTSYDPAAASAAAGTSTEGLNAYDETILTPPTPPTDQKLDYTLNLQANNASVQGLSIMQHGSFFGFSIEMSVVTQLMGKNSSHIKVPFLNLLSQVANRAGSVHVRLGGNTQDFAVYKDEEFEGGHATVKEKSDLKNPTLTPAVLYNKEWFHLIRSVSDMVNVRWYLGIPFNDSSNWRLAMAEHGQAILGDHLIGLQAGNEPDYYLGHGHRTEPYGPPEYFKEFQSLIDTINGNQNIPIKNMLIGPSLASGPWQPDQVWETGWLDAYKDYLTAVTMEHYPTNNCYVQFKVGSFVNPQEAFKDFLTHKSAQELVNPYRASSQMAVAINKPFIMFETNTATCGGLPGISKSFGAALWAIDYGFTMAATNFSHALLHVGGQNVYYNPFTAPPTNQSSFNQWTVGPVFYSTLVVSEAFGKSNVSQIVDTSNNGEFTPSYAIYENGELNKVAMINFMDDPSGAHDITGIFTVQGGQVPQQVYVKYLSASSVASNSNFTWAGQTLGNKFKVDGIMKGELNITTIQCNQGANTCSIPVKAPQFALVFLKDPRETTSQEGPQTFSTTAFTKLVNTATVDPSVLATSNGKSGKERALMGATSPGSLNGVKGLVIPGVSVLMSVLAGAGLLVFFR